MICERHGWTQGQVLCPDCAGERESLALQRDLAAFACVPAALALAQEEVRASRAPCVTVLRVSELAYELAEAMVNERAKRLAE